MTDTLVNQGTGAGADAELDAPLIVITSDGHVQPTLDTELRPYCPATHLATYDEWLAATHDERIARESGFVFGGDTSNPRVLDIQTWNLQTHGQHLIEERLRDMDRDGVAGEIIFHGSAPHHPLPFNMSYIGAKMADVELLAVGMGMYNDWLADFCSVEPERHIGLAQLPMWDIDAAIAEVKRVHAKGLRGVNFPQARAEILPYEDPAWDPFWSVCQELGMTLANHGGAGASTPRTSGPLSIQIYSAESNALSRISPLVRLVFGGVFERFPGLKLIQTEQVGDWFGRIATELDSRWEKWDYVMKALVPKAPSEYCRTNYFVGASFQSRSEAETAIREGWTENVLWGSDYPHPEGTFRFQPDPDETPITHLSLRNTYAGLPGDAVRNMLGENAIRVYGFDRDKLQAVAARINAPTLRTLSEPIEEIPGHWGLAFRRSSFYV
jgi:predicted TIM-barrel fold metal-dependent hydrolase